MDEDKLNRWHMFANSSQETLTVPRGPTFFFLFGRTRLMMQPGGENKNHMCIFQQRTLQQRNLQGCWEFHIMHVCVRRKYGRLGSESLWLQQLYLGGTITQKPPSDTPVIFYVYIIMQKQSLKKKFKHIFSWKDFFEAYWQTKMNVYIEIPAVEEYHSVSLIFKVFDLCGTNDSEFSFNILYLLEGTMSELEVCSCNQFGSVRKQRFSDTFVSDASFTPPSATSAQTTTFEEKST